MVYLTQHLYIIRSEPAVWDAMVSISSLFESPDPCPDLTFQHLGHSRTFNQNQRDALDWYSRSVSAVRQEIQRGGVDPFVGLITCVLFICIEALLGSVNEAFLLYGQGVQLILALKAQKSNETLAAINPSLLEDTIIPIFVRLGAVSLNTQHFVNALLRETGYVFTPTFPSLKSAREAIAVLTAEIQGFELICEEDLMKSHAPNISEELMNQQIALSSKLQSWRTGFNRLMESLSNKDALTPLQAGTAAVLLTYYEMLSVILGVCASPSRITTDDYTRNYENILEQSNISLAATERHDGTQPPFTFEMGAGLPVCTPFSHCD